MYAHASSQSSLWLPLDPSLPSWWHLGMKALEAQPNCSWWYPITRTSVPVVELPLLHSEPCTHTAGIGVIPCCDSLGSGEWASSVFGVISP